MDLFKIVNFILTLITWIIIFLQPVKIKQKLKKNVFFFSKFDELFKKRTLIINIIKNC